MTALHEAADRPDVERLFDDLFAQLTNRFPLADIAHALEQTTADSWVAVNRNGDVRLVVPKGNAYTLARPRPRTEETTP